jgi:hypothetical protein
MKDFDGQPDAVDKYEAALDAYEVAKDQWDANQRAVREVETRWTEQQETARTKYKDFDAVAFSKDTPASFFSIPRLKARKDAGEIAYWLGQNRDEATKIALATHIPGIDTQAKYDQFLREARTNPRFAEAKGRAEAAADIEFDRISTLLSRPAAPPKTPPRPRPTTEVSVQANGHVVSDEKADAISRGDFARYEQLANAEDLRNRRR